MSKKNQSIFSILIIALSIGYLIIALNNKQHSQTKTIDDVIEHQPNGQSKNFTSKFTHTPEGLKNISYISMIKDEDDIIYENLAWHFAVGFRKFILIDNNSSDNTRNLIQKFINETKELATVILIHDPIEEHNQYKLMTAAYRMSHEIWPEAEWIVPVDADEFWIFSKNPSESIASFPKWADSVSVIKTKYYPSEDYDTIKDQRFWHKLHYRNAKWSEIDEDQYKDKRIIVPKIFLRYSKYFSLSMGNHHVIYNGPLSIKADEDSRLMYENILDDVRYASGISHGIFIREFHMRSPEQTKKKFSNGLRAVELMPKTNKLALSGGLHWHKYRNYLTEYNTPEEAANAKFKNYYRYVDIIDDKLEIDEALDLYNKLISGS
jgi:hypothetical protein